MFAAAAGVLAEACEAGAPPAAAAAGELTLLQGVIDVGAAVGRDEASNRCAPNVL
jgi:hypothetical protein